MSATLGHWTRSILQRSWSNQSQTGELLVQLGFSRFWVKYYIEQSDYFIIKLSILLNVSLL